MYKYLIYNSISMNDKCQVFIHIYIWNIHIYSLQSYATSEVVCEYDHVQRGGP